MKNKVISIIIPGRNEAENLDELRLRLENLTRKIEKHNFEFIFIDNDSKDNTKVIIKKFILNDKRWKYISFNRNFGLEASFAAGLSHASGDAIVILFSDLQDPPELIEQMISKWEEGYDIVYSIIRKRSDHNLIKKFSAHLMHIVINKMSGNIIPKNSSDFQLLSRKVVDCVNDLEEKNRYFRGLVHWTGYKKYSIYYDRERRKHGKTKFGFFPSLDYALTSLIAFSTYPLIIISYTGIFMILLSIILSLIYMLSKILMILFNTSFFTLPPPGWTTIVVLILFFIGLNNFFMGTIGLYVASIYNEVKMRPLFVIDEKINF